MAALMTTISPDWVLWTKPPAQWRMPNTGGPQRYVGDGTYHRFPLPGNAYCDWLTSGANGSDVWATSAGSVFRLKAKPVEAAPMGKISAAADGTVCGIRDQVPHRLVNGQWHAMPGRMSWITCGGALEIWALDETWSTGGRPFRWSGSEWVQRGDLRLLSISASSNRQVVVATTYDGRVVRWTPGTMGTWTEISRTPFLHVVSANNDSMYGSDLVHIYRWNGHSWAFEYGANDGGWVSVADDGTVVVADARRRVWRSSGIAGLVQLPIPPSLSACAVDANSVWSWDAGAGGSHYWPGETWELVPAPPNINKISAGVDGTVWSSDYARNLYRYDASDSSWEQMPGTFAFGYLSVGSDAHVILLDQRMVRRWNTTTRAWDTLPAMPLQTSGAAIGGDGTIVGAGSFITPTGARQWNDYRYEDATGWSLLPDMNLYWMRICDANLIAGEIDDPLGDPLLWIGRLPAEAIEEAAGDFESSQARDRVLAPARVFFGDECIASVL